MRRESRRVLVLWIVAIALSLLAALWFHRLRTRQTPEEKAREKAEEIKEKVRQFTH